MPWDPRRTSITRRWIARWRGWASCSNDTWRDIDKSGSPFIQSHPRARLPGGRPVRALSRSRCMIRTRVLSLFVLAGFALGGAARAGDDEKGFEKLFNGKNLDGFKTNIFKGKKDVEVKDP